MKHEVDQTRLQYASFSRRLLAFGLDYLIISGYIILLALGSWGLISGLNRTGLAVAWPSNPIWADLLAYLTLVLPVTLYFSVGEASRWQGSWGKRRLGLQVVGDTGQPISLGRALARNVLKFLPWQIAHTCLFHIEGWPLDPVEPGRMITAGFWLVGLLVVLNVGLVLWGSRRQSLYDRLASTFVRPVPRPAAAR